MSTFEQLKTVFTQVMPQTDVSHITLESSITGDLGVDSLHMVLLAIALEDAFKVRFEGVPLFRTVGDIVEFLDKNRTV
ncbi:MAG: acyl carrier protein [Faecalibacterium sp.]